MSNQATPLIAQDYAITLLRIALGVVFIAHSLYLKVFIFTLPGTASFFETLGLPGWFAYLVCLVETVGGALLVIGAWTRQAAVALLPIALGATWAHAGNGWMFAYSNGGWEYPAYLAVLCAAQAILGEGAYAILPARQHIEADSSLTNAPADLSRAS